MKTPASPRDADPPGEDAASNGMRIPGGRCCWSRACRPLGKTPDSFGDAEPRGKTPAGPRQCRGCRRPGEDAAGPGDADPWGRCCRYRNEDTQGKMPTRPGDADPWGEDPRLSRTAQGMQTPRGRCLPVLGCAGHVDPWGKMLSSAGGGCRAAAGRQWAGAAAAVRHRDLLLGTWPWPTWWEACPPQRPGSLPG